MREKRCDIELVEISKGPSSGITYPNEIRINGQEVWAADTPIEVAPLDRANPLKVTLSILATSLTIRHEEPNDTDEDGSS